MEDFVCSVNAHLTTRQENERLKGIMARIDAYDVVVNSIINSTNDGSIFKVKFFKSLFPQQKDSNNEHLEKVIRQYSVMFDLCAPMKGCLTSQGRYLFLEGDMKYKDNISKVNL